MTDCIFCKIVAEQIPSNKVYEDEHSLVFRDINPVAPTHLVAIPKEHVQTILDVVPQNENLVKNLFAAVTKTVEQQGLTAKGYRVVINAGRDAGQQVPHLHAHILAGRNLAWPPG